MRFFLIMQVWKEEVQSSFFLILQVIQKGIQSGTTVPLPCKHLSPDHAERESVHKRYTVKKKY